RSFWTRGKGHLTLTLSFQPPNVGGPNPLTSFPSDDAAAWQLPRVRRALWDLEMVGRIRTSQPPISLESGVHSLPHTTPDTPSRLEKLTLAMPSSNAMPNSRTSRLLSPLLHPL